MRRRYLRQVRAADLHLDHAVALVEEPAHLVLQLAQALAGGVVAAGGVDEDRVVGPAVAVAVGQVAVQRLPGELGGQVEQRHVDHADGDRALAVPARLLVAHHDVPRPPRVQVAGLVEQCFRSGVEQTRQHPTPEDLPGAVAAVGVEPVAHDRLAVAHHVADDRHDRAVHRAEVDPRVADRRADGDDSLVHRQDLHGVLLVSRIL
jgi:hypothetical protein